MGIREQVNERPAVAIGLVISILAAALVLYAVGTRKPAPRSGAMAAKAWFTVEDGKSWFPDDADKATPFDHEGKPAVRCFVRRCPDGTEWAAYLMRYTTEGKRQDEGPLRAKRLDPSALAGMRELIEIKPPAADESAWVKMSSPKAPAIRSPTCPHGSDNHASHIDPN